MDLCAYVGSWYGCLCICSFLVCGRVSQESGHKIQCRGSFGVGTDTHYGKKIGDILTRRRHVADMLPTFPAKTGGGCTTRNTTRNRECT
jgi:hypothetical protein